MDQKTAPEDFRSGFIGIVGRPNVGKSTILNAIIGDKLAIISNLPQTTRNRIVGIKTISDCQMVFLDTPGIHKPISRLNEIMVEMAWKVAGDSDILLFVIDAVDGLLEVDLEIIEALRKIDVTTFLVINKVDLVQKPELLKIIDHCRALHEFAEYVPVSALRFENIDLIVNLIRKYLPVGPPYYPEDQFTDQTERFMAAETIREKIIQQTRQEIPYVVAVEVESWVVEEGRNLVRIGATIYVEKDSQKAIIIGNGGIRLREIGRLARLEIEKMLGKKVFLEMWVKARGGWRDDEGALSQFGYRP